MESPPQLEPLPPVLDAIRQGRGWVEVSAAIGDPSWEERTGYRLTHVLLLPVVWMLIGAMVAKLLGAFSFAGILVGALTPCVLFPAYLAVVLWWAWHRAVVEPSDEALVRIHADRIDVGAEQGIPQSVVRGFEFEGETLVVGRTSQALGAVRVVVPGWELRHRALLLRYLRDWKAGRQLREPAQLVDGDAAVWIDDAGTDLSLLTWLALAAALTPPSLLAVFALGSSTVWGPLFLFLAVLAGVWMAVGLLFAASFAWVDRMGWLPREERIQLDLEGGRLRVHRVEGMQARGARLLEVDLERLAVDVVGGVLRLSHPEGSCELRPSDPTGAAVWLRARRRVRSGSTG